MHYNIDKLIYNKDTCGIMKYLNECNRKIWQTKKWDLERLNYIFNSKIKALAKITLKKEA